MGDNRDRVARYLSRAEEVRAVAATMKDPDAKAVLLEIAQEYVALATSLAAIDRSKNGDKSR